jgi:hypothetical protein
LTPPCLQRRSIRRPSTPARAGGLFELLLARGAPYDINLACVKGDIDKVRSLLAADAGAVHCCCSPGTTRQ